MAVSTLATDKPIITDDEAKQAQAFYEATVLPQVLNEENHGKVLVMDIDTREYWIDRSKFEIEVALKLRQERPTARLHSYRIGFDAVYGWFPDLTRVGLPK